MKKNFKKVTAFALAAAMALSTPTVALADGNSGNIEGAGTSEGHVTQKATSVTLPTDATATTFAYTMDPERLISGTSHAKYGDAVEFPATGDTGVYFNTGKKGGDGADKDNTVYKNESSALKVVNKSSHSIDLKVKAEAVAVAEATDIPLVAKDAIASATDASLYLGLVVGSEAALPITSTTAAEKTVTINGTASNFKIDANENKTGYVYRELTVAEYNTKNNLTDTAAVTALPWADASFKLEGAVTSGKEVKDTTTAPKVKVTWSWTDPEAAAAAVAAAVSAFKTAHPVASKAAADIEADDLTAITAAITAFEALDADVKTALAAEATPITADTLDALKTAAEALQNAAPEFITDISSPIEVTKDDDLVLNVSFGAGDLGATGATITYNGTARATSEYTVDTEAGTITLKGGDGGLLYKFVNSGSVTNGQERTYTVTFNDTDNTSFDIILKASK